MAADTGAPEIVGPAVTAAGAVRPGESVQLLTSTS